MKKVIPEEKKCLICPQTFLVGGQGNHRRAQRFCSWDCRSAAKINSNAKCAPSLSVSRAAYMAGIVDADGHIGIYKHKSQKTGTASLYAHLSVVNTNLPLLTWIQDTLGLGSLGPQHKETELRKQTYVWGCVNGAADSVVRQLRPYMIVKADRAELLLDFVERKKDPILKADKTWQQEYRQQMLAFNRRGPAATILGVEH